MSKEGARPQVSRVLFKAVDKLVLIFCAETWVVNPRMGEVLGGFQDQVARRMMGRLSWQRLDRR